MQVQFGGDFYLHSVLLNRFGHSGSGGSMNGGFRLNARARQFSSFILLLGKIADAKTFAPECAMIIKDKDDLKIPLMLETMPSAKEFRDAVSSLSPEQYVFRFFFLFWYKTQSFTHHRQRFCKAYRSKQLASSVFAICTIEVKAQMEKVLNLPQNSLTKELSLTKSLTDLFITYQISPDLLSFDGDDKTSTKEKIQRVRENNDAIQKVLNDEKMKEIEEAKRRREIELAKKLADVKRTMAENLDGVLAAVKSVPLACDDSSDDDWDDEEEEEEEAECPDSFGAEDEDFEEELESFGEEKSEEKSKEKSVKKKVKDDKKSPTSKEEKNLKTKSSGDYTKLPALLNQQFDRLDIDNAIRPTKIKTGDVWTLSRQDGLLSDAVTSTLDEDSQHKERNAAYDLLDALTRSGVLSVDCAQFHVIVAATHFFGKNLMETIVKDSVNPIEKVERSHLIMASTISGKHVKDLIQDTELNRLKTFAPMLLED